MSWQECARISSSPLICVDAEPRLQELVHSCSFDKMQLLFSFLTPLSATPRSGRQWRLSRSLQRQQKISLSAGRTCAGRGCIMRSANSFRQFMRMSAIGCCSPGYIFWLVVFLPAGTCWLSQRKCQRWGNNGYVINNVFLSASHHRDLTLDCCVIVLLVVWLTSNALYPNKIRAMQRLHETLWSICVSFFHPTDLPFLTYPHKIDKAHLHVVIGSASAQVIV